MAYDGDDDYEGGPPIRGRRARVDTDERPEQGLKSRGDVPRLAMVHDELEAGLAFIADRLDRAASALDPILQPLRDKGNDTPGMAMDDGDYSPVVRTAAAHARRAHALGRQLDALIDRVQL